ncbi:hypothetical protein B0H13DRAFT_2355124 [Mycena leptocephala]|nr:hypothetical protein B0H13DRAFT_2355124 [Mycena leptocephala]
MLRLCFLACVYAPAFLVHRRLRMQRMRTCTRDPDITLGADVRARASVEVGKKCGYTYAYFLPSRAFQRARAVRTIDVALLPLADTPSPCSASPVFLSFRLIIPMFALCPHTHPPSHPALRCPFLGLLIYTLPHLRPRPVHEHDRRG